MKRYYEKSKEKNKFGAILLFLGYIFPHVRITVDLNDAVLEQR